METGGFLSHGAIVAREYGIPAVVNVAGVMHIIQDGQEIVVDGDTGRVENRGITWTKSNCGSEAAE